MLPKGLPLNATYGAPEPTHGSPAIMVRMSVRHCVEISSRGDGVRPYWQVLAAHQRRQKRGRGAPSRLLYAVAAPLVHGWLEKRSRRRAGGSSLEFRRSPAGPRGPVRGWRPGRRSARGRGPAELEARPPPQSSWRTDAVTHTHVTHHGHPSLTHYQHRSSRTASSPSRTPRSAASARC